MKKLNLNYNCISELASPRVHALRARTYSLPRPLYVLIACEESGIECAAYRALGCQAYSCDIVKAGRGHNSDWHIQRDVREVFNGGWFRTQAGTSVEVPRWDLVISHPPCTYMARLSGIHMFKGGQLNEARFRRMIEARMFFHDCLYVQAPYVAVENPVPLECAALPRPTCYVDPSWFGDRFTKKTLYWLRNLPPVVPTIVHPHPTSLIKSTRGKYRSRTSRFLALAQSIQWTESILFDIDSFKFTL